MIIKIPDIYNEFECIANRCKHTCCASWEIDVDDKSYQYYNTVEGEFGEQLRAFIKQEKPAKIKMLHGKCPFLDAHQLCKVYQNLGKDAMCQVCTEYPRFEEEYTGTRENSLALSCEEVGRLLYSKKDPITFIEIEVEDGNAATVESFDSENPVEPLHDHVNRLDEESETSKDAKQIMQENSVEEKVKEERIHFMITARDHAITILQNREQPMNQRLCEFLRFADEVQKCLDLGQVHKIDAFKTITPTKANNKNQKSPGSNVHPLFQQRMDLICNMEVMEEEWLEEINNVSRMFAADSMQILYEQISSEFKNYRAESECEYEHMAVYFAYRYLVEAIADDHFFDQARFCIVCFLTIRDMDRMRFLLQGKQYTLEDRIETSRIFSKEVEHSQMSMNYLKSKILSEKVFHLEELETQICDC